MFNKDFYPTPKNLIKKMVSKIKGYPENILDPSAGKGDIVEYFKTEYLRKKDIFAIEIEPELCSILKGKDIKVIDNDFLKFSGVDKFDLIIANFPFSNGEYHLLKAIDILYSGQIICLVNAETIKNPYSNIRKECVKKLTELNAEIEFIQDAFIDAERKTNVEVALINIEVKRTVEDDLFIGCSDKLKEQEYVFDENFEVSTCKPIEELVAKYNQTLNTCIDSIISFYKNYNAISQYISINVIGDEVSNNGKLTEVMQKKINAIVQNLRVSYWRKILELKDVKQRMTRKKLTAFEIELKKQCNMDFTENNVRSFIINLIDNYENILTDAIVEIFDLMSAKHAWNNDFDNGNIHYFNGWKTNNSFKINKKIVLPMSYSGNSFYDYDCWRIHYDAVRILDDIDIVMNYFNGMNDYLSISSAIVEANKNGKTTKIKSTFFTCTIFKKGTIHLTFNDEDLLRKFNIAACIGKNWIPKNYGKKQFNQLTMEEKNVINEFEGEENYRCGDLFSLSKTLKLTM